MGSFLTEIRRARYFNTVGSIFATFVIGLMVWGYMSDHLDITLIGGLCFLFVLPAISPSVLEYIVKRGEAKCPRCGSVIEKGALIGQDVPGACPDCGFN